MWRKGNPLALLMGMQIDTANMEIALKTRNKTSIWPSNPTTGHIPWGNHNWSQRPLEHYLQQLGHGSNLDVINMQGVKLSSDWLEAMFQESQWSAFWFQPIWSPGAFAQHEVTILHQVGALVPMKLRDVDQIVCTSPKEEPRPGPIAVLSFPFLSLLKYSWYTVW